MSLRQKPLFAPSMSVEIKLDQNHELLRLSDVVDWDRLILMAMTIRAGKVKKNSGPQPHYREILGAVALMAVKRLTFRDAEDLIYHYAPAKYLCGLMDSDWRMDHVTIFEFTQMLGPEGMEQINEAILATALESGLVDPTEMMSDTTAQEAKIPYPNEVGLMARYGELIDKNLKKVGGKFGNLKSKMKAKLKKIKALLRNSHLFAKTKEEKRKVGKKMFHVVKSIHEEIQGLLSEGYQLSSKAGKEIMRLSEVMETLLPQILHFLETGFVASKKIIHLQMNELYSIVRGKAGKRVEFGLKWGINRIKGGFLQGFLINGGEHRSDKRFCLDAIKIHETCFGAAPKVFGFDRGGYSKANIKKIKKAGVKHVGIAPTGKNPWPIAKTRAEHVKRERAQVEGCIGTVKSLKYGFNKPDACSTAAMTTYGHRAIVGFNMTKLIKELGKLNTLTV